MLSRCTLEGRSLSNCSAIHRNGPVSLGRVQSLGELQLFRGFEPSDLRVSLGTPGVGRASFSFAMYTDVPGGARPRARIRFPNKRGGLLPPETFTLTEKC